MATSLTRNMEIALVDTGTNAGTIQLPDTMTVSYRLVTIKDVNGTFQRNRLTLQTNGIDTFEDGSTTLFFSSPSGTYTFYANTSARRWIQVGGDNFRTQTISSLVVNTINDLPYFGVNPASLVSTPYLDTTLRSTVAGLAQSGYISSTQLTSSLQSTIAGLGTTGYLSSLNNIVSTSFLASTLQSTTIGLLTTISSFIDPTELTSTVIGLGSAGLISTIGFNSSLASTVQGLGTAGYLSSLINVVSTPFLDSSLRSTVAGLGQAGYISTAQLTSSFQSTINGLGTRGYLSTIPANLSATTISTNYLTARSTNISTLYVSNLTGVRGYISSFQVDEIQFGDGTGWVEFGPLRANYISSLQENTGSLYATNIFVGNTSTLNTIRFWGLQGNYSGTYIAEISTGTAWGGQELLMFRGSSINDRIRLQTTGDIRFEPQVASREFSTANALATPTMILQSNLVGIATATPVATLDVRGTVFASMISTQQFFYSSMNGIPFTNMVSTFVLQSSIQSTIMGLGTIGYLSSIPAASAQVDYSTAITSTTIGLGTLGYVSSLSLESTLRGLGTIGYLSSLINVVSTPFLDTSLQSTVRGLGTTAYLSSLINVVSTPFLDTSLQSTVRGLGTTGYLSSLINIVSTPFLDTSLQSTVRGLGTTGYLSSLINIVSTPFLDTSLQSTVRGLGTTGYLSSLINIVSTPFLDTSLQSTVAGLGQSGYISSTQLTSSLQSTVAGLGTRGYLSSLINIISTPFLDSSLLSTVTGLGTINYISTASLVSTVVGLETYTSTLISSAIQAIPFIYAGATLYLNNSQTAGTYKALENILLDTPQQTVNTTVAGTTSNVFVQGFQSDFSLPATLPGGIWTVVLFCQASGVNVSVYVDLYLRDSGGTETLLESLSGSPQSVPTTLTELIITLPVTTATIPAGNVLVLKIFANNSGAPSRTFTSYYENGTYSYVQTTFGAIIDNTVVQSTVAGLGTTGYLSSLINVVSTPFLNTSLQSTVRGLGTTGYLSSINFSNLVSTPFLDNSLQSTVNGLGTLQYLSSPSLQSTILGLNNNFVTSSLTVSSISFGNDFGFLSLGDLQTDTLSSIRIFTSTIQVDGSVFLYDKFTTNYGNITLSNNTLYVDGTPIQGGGGGGSGGDFSTAITSTTLGLGTLGYLSSLVNMVSTPYLESSLLSTVTGLGTVGYLSSATAGGITDTNLASTVVGLATLGYISTSQLTSTVFGLVDHIELRSTVAGLGQAGYISSTQLASSFQSTIRGLGTIGYISSAQFLSTTASYRAVFLTSSFASSNISSVQGYISSLTTDALTVGDGNGWVDIGALRAIVVSTQQENTGALYATNVFVGNSSTLNTIRFWGLGGNYNGTYIAEISTATVAGAQELLMFRGSSINDRIRFQTTGDIRFEPQVTSREFSTANALATPTMILQSNLVGIATASPAATLDVAGTVRSQVISTQQLLISSINGTIYSAGGGGGGITTANLASTVEGLGTINYLSGPNIFVNTIVATDTLAGVYTAASTMYLLDTTDTHDDFPPWITSNQIAGSDPQPEPLRFDVFGSARILKNLYVGSTTTVVTTAGVQTQQVSTLQTNTSTMTLSAIGPLFASTNTFNKKDDLILSNYFVGARAPVLPVIVSSITTDMDLHPEFIGMHFVLTNDDPSNPHTLYTPTRTENEGWWCVLTHFPNSNYFPPYGLNVITTLGTFDVPATMPAGYYGAALGSMKLVISGGECYPFG